MSKYEKLGIDVNYKSSFSKEIYKNIQHIDVLEVHSKKFFWDKEDTYLEKCCNEVPIIFHGLDMSLGSEESLDSEYIYPSSFKLLLCWLHSLTPVTSLSMLPGIRSLAIAIHLEIHRVYNIFN
ncbi:multinuclear nonheme iron-dependent oxidase [Photorhabdus laumondii]